LLRWLLCGAALSVTVTISVVIVASTPRAVVVFVPVSPFETALRRRRLVLVAVTAVVVGAARFVFPAEAPRRGFVAASRRGATPAVAVAGGRRVRGRGP